VTFAVDGGGGRVASVTGEGLHPGEEVGYYNAICREHCLVSVNVAKLW
jgi:hypothetical protein